VAVIFTSELSDDTDGYDEMAARMEALARAQPGFLGLESVREGRRGITVSYWRDRDAVRAWGAHPEHRQAQRLGRERWYRTWSVCICIVATPAQAPAVQLDP
jgi:heme-degrading monooxygenase HmoA